MQVKAKLRGGPMNGKYQNVEDWDRIEVRVPEPIDWRDTITIEEAVVKFKRGHYARSNMSLKNGARVYVWLGWVE